MPEDDDRPRDASSAADPGWSDAAHAAAAWSEAVAPDDISELVDDISAYHRELRAAHRRELMRRLYARAGAAPMSLTVAALAVAAVVALLLTFISPGSSAPSKLPLAQPTATVGTQGGLLPNVTLHDLSGTSIQAQSLRPAVLALIPPDSADASLLSDLAGDASVAQLPLIVVAPAATDPAAAALGGRIDRGKSLVYYDATTAMANDFNAEGGVTVVLVNRDGTVFHIQRGVATEASSQLVPLLQQMLQRTSG